MHCPGCGAEASVTQRFCHSCGFCLEKAHLSVGCTEPSHCAGHCAPDLNSRWFGRRFARDVFRTNLLEKDVVADRVVKNKNSSPPLSIFLSARRL